MIWAALYKFLTILIQWFALLMQSETPLVCLERIYRILQLKVTSSRTWPSISDSIYCSQTYWAGQTQKSAWWHH